MSNPKLKLAIIVFIAMLSLFPLATSSMAATKQPLNYPYGLAVDSKGNLYVANLGGNQVLVYNASHVQVPTKTITNSVSSPTGVAFDPNGNLWVSNAGSTPSITSYSSTGVLNSAATITSGLTQPNAIAFDGLADLWVEDGFANLVMYSQNAVSPLLNIPFGTAITGIAAPQGALVIGANTVAFATETSLYLSHVAGFVELGALTCFAAASDNADNLYCGNQNNTLTVTSKVYGSSRTLTQLGFFPTGIALDNARGLIYVSYGPGNSIAVYNTAGALQTTIK